MQQVSFTIAEGNDNFIVGHCKYLLYFFINDMPNQLTVR